jgi:hypothetical protein
MTTSNKYILLLSVALVISTFALVGSLTNRSVAIREGCKRDKKMYAYVHAAANRALIALPAVPYYQQYPVELEKAKINLNRQIKFFSPLNCPEWWEVWKA